MKKILVLIGMMFSLPSYAAFQCTVNINHVLVYKDGTVNVHHSGRGDYTHICNLSTPREDVSITTCAMWTSMLQNIKKNMTKAQFYYSGEGSCEALPVYGNAPAPVYIGDMKVS